MTKSKMEDEKEPYRQGETLHVYVYAHPQYTLAEGREYVIYAHSREEADSAFANELRKMGLKDYKPQFLRREWW